jgi:hypothetical protein
MALPLVDPCAPYEDAQGNVDLLLLIEGTLSNLECIVQEAKKVASGGGLATSQSAQLAASQLRAAQASHKAYRADQANSH